MHRNQENRVGVIGVGMIGVEQIRGFQMIPRCTVPAIADPNAEALKRAGSDFSIPAIYTDYRELLALEELNAVVVCVPPFIHEEITLAALAAGKHVLCEKPMALNPASAQRMVKKARKAGKILATCSSRFRFSPTVIKAKEMVNSGELGAIYHVDLSGISRRHRPGIDYHPTAQWALEKAKSGGGALMDWGIYDLNILFGLIEGLEVKSVDGFCFRGVDTPSIGKTVFDVEEHGAAILRCNNGITVYWERAWAAHMNRQSRIRIYGSQAGLSFDPVAWGRDSFFEIYEDRSSKPVTIAPDTHFDKCNVHLCVAQDFIEAIVKNRPPATSGEEEAKFLQVIHSVYRSQQKGTPVKL